MNTAPAPVAANEQQHREHWRAIVREELRICARDNGIIRVDDTLDAIPKHLQLIVVALERDILADAIRAHGDHPKLEDFIRQQIHERIRRDAWNGLRTHRA